ncbi:MAG TPA: DUF4136 domain-containing protein, partial [Polyangiaceae bacterium]
PAIGEGQARAGAAEHALGVGSSTVDLVDAQTKAVVWHGSGEIITYSAPDETELWRLVQAILARFPPTGPANG